MPGAPGLPATLAGTILIGLTLLSVGCGQDSSPTAIATPSPVPTVALEEEDSTDTFFDLDRVLRIQIEIPSDDWDTLRNQTRTFEDVMREIEEFALSRPFADIYTWFSATVTVDGETLRDVGIRKKGFVGSQSDVKPSLKLRFDRYSDGQFLGGVMERMTLNNVIQDPSMVNTCLAYQVFSAAGSPAPRCNFALVTVNGKNLGLYVHVEDIREPFLARHFESADGNLYEGQVSDFTPEQRGTIEKETNRDADDWTDVDAVVAAIDDQSDAGLMALAEIVDLDRFLTFWTTEVLIGHWDGYAGDRNNFLFYREPGGRFVFIPWGADDTFHLKDDPNPFDNITNPPASVLALASIANRLYSDCEWRGRYVTRLRELFDEVWNEDELLASVDSMAAIVGRHALPETRAAAADDTERVRKFILKRRGEILADLTPAPPDWPEPDVVASAKLPYFLSVAFETTWGSNGSADPLGEGKLLILAVDGLSQPLAGTAAVAGRANADEQTILPEVADLASIVIFGFQPDIFNLQPAGSLTGLTIVMPASSLTDGARLTIGVDRIAGGAWTIPAGATVPDSFHPIASGALQLRVAGAVDGAEIMGSFSGVIGTFPDLRGWESGEISAQISTSFGSSASPAPLAEEAYLRVNGIKVPCQGLVMTARPLPPDLAFLMPGRTDLAMLTVTSFGADGSADGLTIVLPLSQLRAGSTLVIGRDEIAGWVFHRPAGAFYPNFTRMWGGTLVLSEAAPEQGARIAASFEGTFGEAPPASADEAEGGAQPGLVINEVAASGEPLDWFELHNASDEPIDLSGFLFADDLMDAGKRTAFHAGMVISPGSHVQIELDKDGWPGFALGGDEELGIWSGDGELVDSVDWEEGQAGEGGSFARVPDGLGEFRSVDSPTPNAPNDAGEAGR